MMLLGGLIVLLLLCGSSQSLEINDGDGVLYDDYYRLAEQLVASSRQNKQRVSLANKAESSQIRNQNYKKHSVKLHGMNDLTRVLSISNDGSVRVQARCTYHDLVRALLPHGMVPAVVPEFRSITVGGAVVGGALESSSHWAGQVSDTVLRAHVLLGNGTVTQITPNDDLFAALPGSYGTLAILLDVTLRTIPSKPLVRLTLNTFADRNEGIAALVQNNSTDNQPNFLEALDFPSGHIVIVAGDFVEPSHDDEVTSLVAPYGLWFYEMVQDRIQQQEQQECGVLLVPVEDYLFRYERGAFWMARPMAFRWVGNPLTLGLFFATWRYTRYLFRWAFTATRLYRLLHMASPMVVRERMIILDAYMPAPHAATQLVHHVRQEQQKQLSTPLWLCPIKTPKTKQPLSTFGNATANTIMINVGVYGRVLDGRADQHTLDLDKAIEELGGRKMLYSQLSISKEEFYSKYVDGEQYQRLRKAYHADQAFASLDEKLLEQEEEQEEWGMRYWLTKLLL